MNTSIGLAIDHIIIILSNYCFNSLIIQQVVYNVCFSSAHLSALWKREREVPWIAFSQTNAHLQIECHKFKTFLFFDRLCGKQKSKQMNRLNMQLCVLFESLKSRQQLWWWRRSTNIFGLCVEIANLFFFCIYVISIHSPQQKNLEQCRKQTHNQMVDKHITEPRKSVLFTLLRSKSHCAIFNSVLFFRLVSIGESKNKIFKTGSKIKIIISFRFVEAETWFENYMMVFCNGITNHYGHCSSFVSGAQFHWHENKTCCCRYNSLLTYGFMNYYTDDQYANMTIMKPIASAQ